MVQTGSSSATILSAGTLRFTGHKRTADCVRSAFNDEAVVAKAVRLFWSFVQAVVGPSHLLLKANFTPKPINAIPAKRFAANRVTFHFASFRATALPAKTKKV